MVPSVSELKCPRPNSTLLCNCYCNQCTTISLTSSGVSFVSSIAFSCSGIFVLSPRILSCLNRTWSTYSHKVQHATIAAYVKLSFVATTVLFILYSLIWQPSSFREVLFFFCSQGISVLCKLVQSLCPTISSILFWWSCPPDGDWSHDWKFWKSLFGNFLCRPLPVMRSNICFLFDGAV